MRPGTSSELLFVLGQLPVAKAKACELGGRMLTLRANESGAEKRA